MTKEKVTLCDVKEAEIDCRKIYGRKAFKLAPQILKITELKKGKDEEVSAACEMNSAEDICWDEIVAECPHRDQVTAKCMHDIYSRYAKEEIDFALKKNLESFSM